MSASVLILTGRLQLIGALGPATFTAGHFWTLSGKNRFMTENAFLAHLGLVGALVLFAWDHLNRAGRG